jgi:Divergent InlB B-repeat domain
MRSVDQDVQSQLRLRHLSLVLLVSITAIFGSAGSARAAGEHPYLLSSSLENEFLPSIICGVATDPNGYIYVASGLEHTVFVYESKASARPKLLTQLGDSLGIGGYPCSPAVDSSGDVYVTDPEIEVLKYKPSEFPPTSNTTYTLDESVVKGEGVIDNSKSVSVAVDPATQNVYVAEVKEPKSLHSERIGSIIEYKPDGTPVDEAVSSDAVPGAVYSSIGVYGANGDIYAIDEIHDKVYIFTPTGEVVTVINGDKIAGCSEQEEDKEECFGSLQKAHLAVEQTNGDVYIDDVFSHGVVDQFEASGTFVTMIGPKFGPNSSLIFEDPEHVQATIAVDDGFSSLNVGDVYVFSQSETGHSASLYAFGPLSHTVLYSLSVAEKGAGSGVVDSNPAGIECGSSCSHEYEENTKIALTATPTPGSEFDGWAGGGCSGTGVCEVTMTKPISVVATFSLVQHTLKVVKTGVGSQAWRGTVTSSPAGIECGLACSHAYNANTKIILTASAASGTVFTGWSGGDCTGSTSSTCQTTLDTDTIVTATFSPASSSSSPLPIILNEAKFFTPSLLSLSDPTITVSAGKAAPLKLTCTGNSPTPCSGELKLTAKIKHGKKTVSQTIAQTSCDIPTGDTRTITIKLNNTATKFLTINKTLTATLTGPNNLDHTIKLKTNPQTHHKHS